jgi:hypothetical protein
MMCALMIRYFLFLSSLVRRAKHMAVFGQVEGIDSLPDSSSHD